MLWFKELYDLWKADNSLTRALQESHVMLEETHKMFLESVRSLRESDTGKFEFNVYEKDQLVNDYMREARKKVLKHLAITGGMNIIPGLVLTSIVIDIERIGDYTKNIMDLAVAHPKRLRFEPLSADFDKMEAAADETFTGMVSILKSPDRKQASVLIKDHLWVLARCDEIVDSLIKNNYGQIEAPIAAACALYARYLKRIQAHLLNIATSVVNPFENIGFQSEEES